MEDKRRSLILIWESLPPLYGCAEKLAKSSPKCKTSLEQDPDETAVSVLGEPSSISAWTANLKHGSDGSGCRWIFAAVSGSRR